MKKVWPRKAIIFLAGMFLMGGCITMGKKAPEPPPTPPPAPQPVVEEKPPLPPPPSPKPALEPELKKEEPKVPQYLEHVVRWSGESFSLISKWYTGKFSNWKALVKANPEINPRRMRKGQIIRIPMELVKTQEPMPKSFVEKYTSKKSEEEPVLFGPKK